MFQDKTQTILIVCMMIIAPLSLYGVFTGGPEGPAGVSGEQGENGTEGSSFHLVQVSADLPTCDESVNNQIFFVANDNGFEVCQNQAWSVIDLTGLQGEPGSDGNDGVNGKMVSTVQTEQTVSMVKTALMEMMALMAKME